MLAVLFALTPGAPTKEGQGQAAIAPGIDPLVDPATGRIINRWNKPYVLSAETPSAWVAMRAAGADNTHPGHIDTGNDPGHAHDAKPSKHAEAHDFPHSSALTGGRGLWSPAIDAAAAFCAYRNTKYALDGVWTIKHKDTCSAACNFVNAAGWVLYEEHQLYDMISNDTNNADVWFNGVTGTSEGNGPSPREDESDLEHGPNCLIAFHGATPTEGHNRQAVADEAIYSEYLGTVGIAKRWTEEMETMQERMSTLHGNMSNYGKTMPGHVYVTGHSEGGTLASIFAYLANHKDDPMGFGRPVTKLTVYGVPPSANFSMDDGQSKDGCFDGTAYYTRLPKGTPYTDSPEGLDEDMSDIYSIMSGYPVTKEVQDAVRDHSIFEDLDGVHVHIKHAIHTRKSKHVRIQWQSLDVTGMITDEVVHPKENLQHLSGPGLLTKCGEEPPSFAVMANNVDLAVRAANESKLEWHALTISKTLGIETCLTRKCAGERENAIEKGADALNMHAPETYAFSLCMLDKVCTAFMLSEGEPHRDLHPDHVQVAGEDTLPVNNDPLSTDPVSSERR